MSHVQNPFLSSPPAPAPPGTAPPGPITLHPGSRITGFAQPVQRSFRRSFLDRQDPFESAGLLARGFSFNGSYEVPGARPQDLADEIRQEIHARMAAGNLANAEVEMVDLDDARQHNEPLRRFVVSRTDTRRRTLATVNAYVQPYGQHLYYSVRSYLLPPLSWWKLAFALLFCYAVLRLAAREMELLRFFGMASSVPLLFSVAFLAFVFRRLIRNLLAGDPVPTALRKQFPRRFDWGTFNNDDVAAFLKTNLDLTLGTIIRVLEKHGIDTGGLRAVVQNLQTVNVNNGSTFNVNTAGGGISGAVFGGTGNQAYGKVGP
jgi:hypothetical protein